MADSVKSGIKIVCDASFRDGNAMCGYIITTPRHFISYGNEYFEGVSTSIRAELLAIVLALEDLNTVFRSKGQRIKILSDCDTVVTRCKRYLYTETIPPTEVDKDLYLRFLKATQSHHVKMWYVVGHKTARSMHIVVDYGARAFRKIMESCPTQ